MSRNMPGNYSQQYPQEYERYSAQYGGQIEGIGWKWWDTQTYVSGTTVNLQGFFNVRATQDLSNMEVAFQLAAPKAFLVRDIRFFAKQLPEATVAAATAATQTGAINDLVQLTNTGVFTFTVGNKSYNQEPLWCMTSGGGVVGSWQTGDIDVVVQHATLGIQDPRAVNTLSKPIFIPPQMNFTAQITWPAALTLALGDTTVSVILDGDLLRPVQ